jgi:predicted phosphodiesterase
MLLTRSIRARLRAVSRLLAGEDRPAILFGHSHQQIERPGPNRTTLVNPGGLGSPLDGDTRAALGLYENGRASD